jgi:CheY-like chemotaxis protein
VNSHIEISVTDTGVGISPDFLPHVFERFRQADASTTRRQGGLGLGLAIVKQLTELHGGTVRAKSPGEGQGATFVIALPIAVVHDGPEKVHPKEHEPVDFDCSEKPLQGIRALVVDDELDARQLVRRVLSDCGAEVAIAESVIEAMKLVETFAPDILVSDVGMPEQDGYDLIRRVRSRLAAKALPAVALTAFARSEDRRRALLAGFQTHVPKPVEPAELVAVVASLVERTGGEA